MQNVQITVDEDLLRAVDKAGKPLGLKRSQIVRQALRAWLQKKSVERFEQEWITALQASPDDGARAELWANARKWSGK
jgi:metal-responsive CopG/Arc/MetJ family transcriptional regulator